MQQLIHSSNDIMTKEEFEKFWIINYPNTLLIPDRFKTDYADRWFRIHSLPESKRYPENDKERKFVLERQNRIITDILGDNTQILLITGEFNWGERESFITDEEDVFKGFSFTRLDTIDLFKAIPDEYDEFEVYRPAFSEVNWIPNSFDDLLMEIADDKVRIFFASVNKEVLIAPYDGGIDFILKDSKTRDFYKEKYRDWLSDREDGY